MMKPAFCVCIISLLFESCGNNEPEISKAVPEPEKQLKELISQYPDSLLLKENLVEYLRRNGQYEQAITETEKALERDTLNAHIQDIKATLLFENGDTINAIKTFEKAIAIDPRPQYRMSLGSLYAQTKNPKAISIADELLKAPAANNRIQALFIKGLYFNYTGDKIKAIPFFDTCIKIDYRYMLAYREKAIGLYDLKKFAEARDVLKQALTVQNRYEEGYYWMGRIYEKLDQKKEAIDNYQHALKLDSNFVEAREALEKIQ